MRRLSEGAYAKDSSERLDIHVLDKHLRADKEKWRRLCQRMIHHRGNISG
jgi:hypothetical protein